LEPFRAVVCKQALIRRNSFVEGENVEFVYVTVGTAMLLLVVGAGLISRLIVCLYLFMPSTRTVRRKAEKIQHIRQYIP